MKRLTLILSVLLTGIGLYAQKGTQIYDSIFHDKYRSFIVYIPDIYNPGQPVPLLLNLHGTSESASYQNNLGNFRPVADTANFIIVLPNGEPVPLMGGARGWNIFPTSSGVDDFGFLADLIDTISTRYNIDRNRVYSTGHSAGAIMSYRLACSMSDRIAAIAPVNGFMFPVHMDDCDAKHPTPVMETHGTLDPVRNWNGDGPVTKAVHMDTLMAHWVNFNGCNPEPAYDSLPNVVTTDYCWVQHFTWSGGRNGSSVELYKVIYGGHTWPGSTVKEPYGATNMDYNACEKIWQFLSKYKLNILTPVDDPPMASREFRVFPNPVCSALYIDSQGDIRIQAVVVRDILGKEVFRSGSTGSQVSLTINTEDWSKGLYLVSISDGNSVSTFKVVK